MERRGGEKSRCWVATEGNFGMKKPQVHGWAHSFFLVLTGSRNSFDSDCPFYRGVTEMLIQEIQALGWDGEADFLQLSSTLRPE